MFDVHLLLYLMHLLPRIAVIALAYAGIEGTAYWWMHPAPAGQHEPVLAYRPVGRGGSPRPLIASGADRDGNATIPNFQSPISNPSSPAPAQSSSYNQPSTLNHQLSTSYSSLHSTSRIQNSKSTAQPLPELYSKAAPMLRCSGGQVFRIDLDDSLTLHCAFFEWDGTDTGSVLEAFRHMPEACMGSIGMQLVSKEKPIPYLVGPDRRLARHSLGDDGAGRDSANGVESQGCETQDNKTQDRRSEEESSALTHSPNSKLNIQHSTFATQSLLFDHTIFRDPGQGGGLAALNSQVHAFRAVWVSGLDQQADPRSGLSGNDFSRLRAIRLRSALTRFRPEHARVIQGAVRGAPNAEAAWQAFQDAMLKDLSFSQEF